jgi:glycosyltransferase involved in cell wall biosynthesis
MRVLFVTNLWPDDVRPWHGSFVYSQGRSLRAAGVDLDVLAIRGYASKGEYARAGLDTLRRNFDPSYDVVHAHYGYSAVVARLELRAPLVISYCGDDLLGTPEAGRPWQMSRGSRALAWSFAQVSRVAAATITKSREMERCLPRRAQARNHVIPNGVDLDMFAPIDQAQARRQLGWSEAETVVLFAGNPSVERKNHPLAEEACRLAAEQRPGLRLRVASGIPPEQMPVWMSAADALIHPAWSEGSPNVVKEAMACELPVVATPVGDIEERLAGLAGCHVVPPQADRFAEALLDATEHKPLAAARQAVSELSLERVARRVMDVYESVAS